jgi:hypothetical protein
MASLVQGLERALFGRQGRIPVNSLDDEDANSIIFEGGLDIFTGLAWWSGHWRLMWCDDFHTQATLVRFKHRHDRLPLKGSTNSVLISCIKTLVPIEDSQRQVNPTSLKRASENKASESRTRSRFAFETTDGRVILLSAPDVQSRSDWMTSLYSHLVRAANCCSYSFLVCDGHFFLQVRQAQLGLHDDPSIIESVRAQKEAFERQRKVIMDTDKEMKKGTSPPLTSPLPSPGPPDLIPLEWLNTD